MSLDKSIFVPTGFYEYKKHVNFFEIQFYHLHESNFKFLSQALCSWQIKLTKNCTETSCKKRFFSIMVLFHEHSRFTGQQEKEEPISLTLLYHFHPLHIHLDISWAITAKSSVLHIASSQNQFRNLWFPSASH